MEKRSQVLDLADHLERSLHFGGSMSPAEVQLCVESLRAYADNELRFEIASLIEQATGRPWHDSRVLRAANAITRLYEDRMSA